MLMNVFDAFWAGANLQDPPLIYLGPPNAHLHTLVGYKFGFL